jgi:hypothetical protein
VNSERSKGRELTTFTTIAEFEESLDHGQRVEPIWQTQLFYRGRTYAYRVSRSTSTSKLASGISVA